MRDRNDSSTMELVSRGSALGPILEGGRFERILAHPAIGGVAAIAVALGCAGLDLPFPLAFALALGPVVATSVAARRQERRRLAAFESLASRVRGLSETPIESIDDEAWQAAIDDWNRDWPALCRSIQAAQALVERTQTLPGRLEDTFGKVVQAADRQEEAVEETASLVANMRQSVYSIGEQVDLLMSSSDESSSSILQLGRSIDEVANNTARLHEVVDASTSSVHEMSTSIRQVAEGAEQVREMAESTATAVIEMDRSVQEVSTNAIEAAALTDRAHEGASAGREAVRSTISDIEQISSLTTQAMDRLAGLVTRISQIGNILSAIDEINDETNLLSLNAAIIAAQAGEQGKAFLVVANHVKTLARRTAGSTHDIERLIAAIEQESAQAVQAMEAGMKAVAGGVDRSRDAGRALESIQEACSDASQRVGEIARATAEQSRNSKGVAESTLRTSTQIQQISQAIADQRRASESMLASAESALASCLLVHRSTDEQRETSRYITSSIGAISQMIREIGIQARVHASASDDVGDAVMRLLDNAKVSGSSALPLRDWVGELDRCAELARWPVGDASDAKTSAETSR